MKQLNRETLAEQVADAIANYIETEQLGPGDSLPSTVKLAENFGVSRPVIREALKTLEGREILTITNGRTAMVKPITGDGLRNFFSHAIALDRKSLIELLEVRNGLEVQSAALAAKNGTNEDIVELEKTLIRMRQSLNDPTIYTELDVRFHTQIAAATKNKLMFLLIESIREALANTIQEGLRSRFNNEQFERVQELHELVFDSIKTRDHTRAAEAMTKHFSDAIDAILRAEILQKELDGNENLD